jgi:hypothetical protein
MIFTSDISWFVDDAPPDGDVSAELQADITTMAADRSHRGRIEKERSEILLMMDFLGK